MSQLQESLRYNCDPFDEHSSEKIWIALEESQLAPWVRERGEDSGPEDPNRRWRKMVENRKMFKCWASLVDLAIIFVFLSFAISDLVIWDVE